MSRLKRLLLRPSRVRSWVGIAVLQLLVCSSALCAPVSEYELKAALIYKIAKFVSWPETALGEKRQPIGVCIVGPDPFGASIDTLESEVLHSRRVTVRRYPAADAELAADCRVAFVAVSDASARAAVLRSLERRPILTVGDSAGFAGAGGVLGMRLGDGRIKFEINLAACEAQGLVVSAQVLQLATIVDQKDHRR